MSDLIYSQANFNEMLRRIDLNIKELESELEEFNRNFEIVKNNWSGTEYNKREANLLEIRKTLETALTDQRKQKNYLEQKNHDFAESVSKF